VKRRYFRNDGYWTFYDGEWNLFGSSGRSARGA
jgi:hypothetical protein